MRFNVSKWALEHRSFVLYLMIASVLLGVLSYVRLGRDEDPAFVIKTMVVRAAWPGATIDDTLNQVTERLEQTLRETPHLDFLRSFTSPGVTTIFVNLKGSTPAHEVPDIWYHVRKSISDMRGTLPAGVTGPGFDDEFGDTFGIIYGFTADGFTQRQLRDYVEQIRSQLFQVPDVSKVDMLGEQDETIFVEFSTQQLAGLGIDRNTLVNVLRAQNVVTPAGVIQTGDERLLLRVSGSFHSVEDVRERQFRSERAHSSSKRRRRGAAGIFGSAQAAVQSERKVSPRTGNFHARRRRRAGAWPKRHPEDELHHCKSTDRH